MYSPMNVTSSSLMRRDLNSARRSPVRDALCFLIALTLNTINTAIIKNYILTNNSEFESKFEVLTTLSYHTWLSEFLLLSHIVL